MATSDNRIIVQIEVRKSFQRAMQEPVAMEHIAAMIQATSSPKWTLELVSGAEGSTNWYRTIGNYPCDVAVFFTLTGPNSTNTDTEINDRLTTLQSAAMGSKNQKRNWSIYQVNGEAWKPLSIAEKIKRNQEKGEGFVTYADVSVPEADDVKVVFKDMYGVDSQISRIVTSMRRSVQTDFKYRSHGLLIGPPGCGKSQTLSYAKNLFPEPGAVLVIDGTAMTSAGIIDTLNDLETMPRFIFIEEIDKADKQAVSVLLGLMDKHGEIRKTTYRDKIAKECRVSVFATANSLTKIRDMQEGAVLSRFGNPITYTRPSDEMLKRILHRELDDYGLQLCEKPNGKRCGKCESCKTRGKWIEVTLSWCHKFHDTLEADTLDPRFVIDMCVNGQEDLLNNQYTSILEATSIKKADVSEWE